MKRWRWIAVIGTAILLCACGARTQPTALFPESEPEAAQEPQVRHVLLTHSETVDSLTHQLAGQFQAELEELSGGRMLVSIYPNNTLGSLADGVHAFSNGAIEFRLGSGPSDLLQIVKWTPVLSGLSLDGLNGLLEKGSAFWDQVQEECGQDQCRLLAIFPAEYRVLTSNRRIDGCEDLAGLKLRVPERGYDQQFWSVLGADTATSSIEEVYFALQQGEFEAQENTLSSIYANRFYEYQKYVISTNHKVYFDALYVSLPFYEDLSPEERAWVEEAANQVCGSAVQLNQQWQERCLEQMSRAGVAWVNFPEEQRAAMREQCQEGLLASLKENYGGEKVDALLAELTQAAAEE